jgi:hypothetical protein
MLTGKQQQLFDKQFALYIVYLYCLNVRSDTSETVDLASRYNLKNLQK